VTGRFSKLQFPNPQNPNHPVTQSPSHPVTQSPSHPVTQSLNHPVTKPEPATLNLKRFDGSAGMGFFVKTNAIIMIQRIQTIFLVLVVVINVLVIFVFPVYQVNPATNLKAQVSGGAMFNPLLLIPLVCISLLAIIAIFMYNNRPRQLKICRGALIITLLVTVNAIIFPQFILHNVPRENILIGAGAYLLPVNVILFALAAYRIKKDEDLVKSADRLR
jgi:hypothetical protein